MRKKIGIALIGIMALSLVACGDRSSQQSGESTSTIESEATVSAKDFEQLMEEKGWDYQYLKSDAVISVATQEDIDEALANEIISSHVYEFVSVSGITFKVKDTDEYIHINGLGVKAKEPNEIQADIERRMNEKGWDYQYLKSDAVIIVASQGDVDEELANEIINSNIYEYVSNVGISFKITENDEYVYVKGLE